MSVKEEKPKKAKSYIKHYKKLNKAQCRELLGINNYKILACYGDFDIYECIEEPDEYAIKKIARDEAIYKGPKMDLERLSVKWLLNIVKEYKDIWNE